MTVKMINKKLVAVHSMIGSLWYLVHAESHQQAFRLEDNLFKTRNAAVYFANTHGCEVVEFNEDDLHLKLDA